jgi:hypothetical protein
MVSARKLQKTKERQMETYFQPEFSMAAILYSLSNLGVRSRPRNQRSGHESSPVRSALKLKLK